ncbi:hypothetical protein O8H62_001282 [Enterobacter asburiae]|nr:hypothetical protein [Enterobacter asburiae]MCW1828058.1 hypothetical protein [Enterobacter asburiae]
MNRFSDEQPAWHDYLGDTLRGDVPVNQLIPQHPYLLDTLQLEEALHKNTEHIMLLNMDEAYAVMDALYNKGTTYSGNIKDAVSGIKNMSKLVSYKDAGKLVINLKGLGIKAIPYVHKGVTYIKITGYPSVRRILNGTRYAVNNPKILELGIGNAGINAGILSGARFCIYFVAAQRVVEYIFSSEHDVATFIGNITMDVAKVIVTIFVTKIAVAIVTGVTTALSIVVPISAGIAIIVVIGFLITYGLLSLDEQYHLSERLIKSIRKGLDEHQRVMDWNLRHSNHYLFSMMNGHY